jgi:hypothetical protein
VFEDVIPVAAYRFTINGVSLLNYLAEDGIKWTRFDVEAPDTGRTLDGVMHRGRVASKVRLDITCRPLKSAEAMAVLGAIKPEFVTVRYIDPQDGSVTRTMYSNNIPTICATVNPDGTAVWKGLTFPLIER